MQQCLGLSALLPFLIQAHTDYVHYNTLLWLSHKGIIAMATQDHNPQGRPLGERVTTLGSSCHCCYHNSSFFSLDTQTDRAPPCHLEPWNELLMLYPELFIFNERFSEL